MTNGNVLSGIPPLIGTAGTIIFGGIVLREIDLISRRTPLRKKKRIRRRSK